MIRVENLTKSLSFALPARSVVSELFDPMPATYSAAWLEARVK